MYTLLVSEDNDVSAGSSFWYGIVEKRGENNRLYFRNVCGGRVYRRLPLSFADRILAGIALLGNRIFCFLRPGFHDELRIHNHSFDGIHGVCDDNSLDGD